MTKKTPTKLTLPDILSGDGPNLEFTTDNQRKLLIKSCVAGDDPIIDKLIIESWPQVDLLYEKAMAVAPWPKGGLSNRKDRVMEFYQGRREQFPAIRGWMLDDKNLFNLRQGQERFDFRVELFRKIVNFYFGCDISIREMRPRVKNLQKDPSKKSTP